jgi:hypothetical protein
MSDRICVRSTSRNAAGLIPDSGPGISHTMALGSTQPLTKTSTSDVTWNVKETGE